MAQFDFKNAILLIRDGYANAGAINHASGYDVGDTTLLVDGFVGIVATGDIIVVTGDPTNYTVTAHTETLGNTTSLTITPALALPILDNGEMLAYQPNVDTAAVNNVAGYPIGTVTLLIDGFVGIITNGDRFKLAGDTTIYTVTAHVETLGDTTSVTIAAPGLVAAVIDNQVLTVYQPNVDTILVNNGVAGYVAGTTKIAVSGVTGIITAGSIFYLAGDTTKYTVTGHTETLGNTTGITFTPPIPVGVTVANSSAVTIGPHEVEVTFGEGNFTWSEKINREYTLNRGRLGTVKNGDEVPLELKIDALWESITASNGNPPTLEDVFNRVGGAADWVSVSTDECEPYAVDLVMEYTPPCETGANSEPEYITFPDFRHEQIDHDSSAGTLSISGKCNVTRPNAVRISA